MSEEFFTNYKDGDIVWVKLGPSWWPGEVKDLNKIPSDEIEFKKPPLVVVQFFEEDTYEYVRSWANIYPYNSEKKVDFIKKGMAAFHSKLSHMEKFPKDVVTAEGKVGGNSNILSEPAYRPEARKSYAFEMTSSPSSKKKTPKETKSKNQQQRDTSHITHRRFLGCDDYKAYICIQYPGKDRTPGDSEDEEVIRINTEPEQEYNCHSCSYSTRRLEVMILHTKSHIQGHYVSSPKRKRPTVPKSRKKEVTKKQKQLALSKSHDSSSDEVSEPPKEKKRKTKSVSSKKATEIVKPKRASDICNDLLAEWDDTDDEVGLLDKTTSETDENIKSDSNEIVKNGKDMDKSTEGDIEITEDEDKDTTVSDKDKDTTLSDKDTTISEQLTEDDLKSKSTSQRTMDQEIKSCFDFEEDEEEDLLNSPVVEGRKIPRVIPPTDKRKSEILEDIIDLEEGINKEEILKVSQSFNEKKSDNIELENVFKDFLDEVSVPKLPEVNTDLKPTQNFHCVKTIKFPDKLDEPPKKDRDKHEEEPAKPINPKNEEESAKLINPKKRFVKSFEDFENQLHQEEIRRKEKDELQRKRLKEQKEQSLKLIKRDEPEDDNLPKVDIAQLQCSIMSKIIDEINISDESKHNIMSKMHKRKSPRGKIMDSYLGQSEKGSKQDDIDLPSTSKGATIDEAKSEQNNVTKSDSQPFLGDSNADDTIGDIHNKKMFRKRSLEVEEQQIFHHKEVESKYIKTRHKTDCLDKHKSTTDQTIKKLSFRLSLSERQPLEDNANKIIPENEESQPSSKLIEEEKTRSVKTGQTDKTERSQEPEVLKNQNDKTDKLLTLKRSSRYRSSSQVDVIVSKQRDIDQNFSQAAIIDKTVAKSTNKNDLIVDKIDIEPEITKDQETDVERSVSNTLEELKSPTVEIKDNTGRRRSARHPSPEKQSTLPPLDEPKSPIIENKQTVDKHARKRAARASDKNLLTEETEDAVPSKDDKNKQTAVEDLEATTAHKRTSRNSLPQETSNKTGNRRSSRNSSNELDKIETIEPSNDDKNTLSTGEGSLSQSASEVDVTTEELERKPFRKRNSRQDRALKSVIEDTVEEHRRRSTRFSEPEELKLTQSENQDVDVTTIEDEDNALKTMRKRVAKQTASAKHKRSNRYPSTEIETLGREVIDEITTEPNTSQSSSETKVLENIADETVHKTSSKDVLPSKDPILETNLLELPSKEQSPPVEAISEIKEMEDPKIENLFSTTESKEEETIGSSFLKRSSRYRKKCRKVSEEIEVDTVEDSKITQKLSSSSSDSTIQSFHKESIDEPLVPEDKNDQIVNRNEETGCSFEPISEVTEEPGDKIVSSLDADVKIDSLTVITEDKSKGVSLEQTNSLQDIHNVLDLQVDKCEETEVISSPKIKSDEIIQPEKDEVVKTSKNEDNKEEISSEIILDQADIEKITTIKGPDTLETVSPKQSEETTKPEEPPKVIESLLTSPDKKSTENKIDFAATLENREKLRLPFKKGRWSIRTSHPKKYTFQASRTEKINIDVLSKDKTVAAASGPEIKNSEASEPEIKNTEASSEPEIKNTEAASEPEIKNTEAASEPQIKNAEASTKKISTEEIDKSDGTASATSPVTTRATNETISDGTKDEDLVVGAIEETDKDAKVVVEEINDKTVLNLNVSEFSVLCSPTEEFSVGNTSLELPEYAICEPSTKFGKRKRALKLPKSSCKKKLKASDDDEEIEEDDLMPKSDFQEVVNDSTIESVEEETIFEVTIGEESVSEECNEIVQSELSLNEESEKIEVETLEKEPSTSCGESDTASAPVGIKEVDKVVDNEDVVVGESTAECAINEQSITNEEQVTAEEVVVDNQKATLISEKADSLLESSEKVVAGEDKDLPADEEDEKLTDLVSDIVQKLNSGDSDKNQEELDMELEEEIRLSPKNTEETKKKPENADEKIPNEVEIFCASNSNDSFKFCIQTNLSNLSRSEEISAIALATLSETKTEEIPPKVDLPSPEKLSDTEMAAIEGNLTVMSEKDLADAQVEITSDKVISSKKPVTLSTFSMDFSESTSTNNVNEPRKQKEIDSKGTEFTSKAITKEFKPKSHGKKVNTYNQCELLNILEGNSDAEKKVVEFQTSAKSFTGDICDFEEHIPSQIVCTKQFKQDMDDEFKKKDKSSVISTTSKLLERLTEIKKDPPAETPPKTIKPKLKPIILSEQIIKPASDPKKIIPQSNNLVNDIEDVEAFIIRKDIKKSVEAEATVPGAKHVRKSRQKTIGKANILQQTIITPAGEIIQPAATLPKMKTVLVNASSITARPAAESTSLLEANKTTKTVEAETSHSDENVFDIFNMPIVLSDQILTPESIENMPIVIENNSHANKPKPSTQQTKTLPNKVITKIVTSGKSTPISPKVTTVLSKFTKPRLLQTTSKSGLSLTPNILSRTSKPGKYIIVSQSTGTSQPTKKTIIKKTSFPAGIPSKISGVSEGTGHKIMVVTNQQGHQQRLLLTPAQQKVLGYQPKVEKTVLKSESVPKSVSTVMKPEIGAVKQKITTTAGQVISGMGTPRQFKSVVKRTPASPSSQKVAKTTKTILITNKHGQTIKKIATTDDDIDKQVAEQLEAIKASSGMQFSSHSKSESVVNKFPPKSPVRKSYNRKQEPKLKTIPTPVKSDVPVNPTPKKVVSQIPEAKKLIQEEPKQQIDRPLNQLVIQDALGNQTTITEGQILALPSETVDGQPQSYMLVTLDQAGNLTPLNNEALMSLDPNLGLGGDLSNVVLQIDQGALGTGNINQPTPLAQPATVKITSPGEELQAGTSKIDIPRETTVPLALPIANEVPMIEQKLLEENIMVPPTEAPMNIVSNPNGEQTQQLIVTGDPIATQKFLESLSEGTTDLANIIANAEGKSILIQADGQQILINTNTDSQMLTNIVESTEGDGNPIFATQPNKSTDILAAALADTDVFPTQSKISQLSPNNALYPINVSNVLETSLTLNSPIMTPLEVPSSNNKKIPDDETDILTQVPKNVDLPITITDPNISQTVANQQVATLIGNEFQTNLELGLSIPEGAITAVSTGLSSPGYNYSLSTLDDNDISHKQFNSSMPLLNDDVEDGLSEKKCEKVGDKNIGAGSFLEEESRFTLGGGMCSSLSEPPPEMFDIPDNAFGDKTGSNIPLSLQSTPDPKDDETCVQTESSNEGSCEIPLQPKIVAKSADLTEANDI